MRYLHLTFTSLATCALIAALSGCGSSVMNNSMSGNPPAVSATGAEANGVAPNRAIYVQFNEAMDLSTINNQTMVLTDSSGRSVPGTVGYDSSFDVAGFQPNPALQTSASYTLRVTTGAKSAQGQPLQSDFKYNFTTRAETDKSPIGVKAVTPANGATCVSASTLITITFTEGADVNSLTSSNIVVTGPGNAVIPAKISYNVATAQATIAPNAALPSGSITVTVSNVADAAGVAMTTPYTWSFSTACSTAGGGGGTATTQYMTSLYAQGLTAIHGQVTVDTQGMVAVKLTSATAGASYTVQFCPAFDSGATTIPAPNCFNLTTIATDSSGNGTATVKFPNPGDWAGDFFLNDSSGKAHYQTFIAINSMNATYMAMLLPDTNTNGGVMTTSSPQEPLTSGTVTVSNGNMVFTLKGSAPNTSFMAFESETVYTQSSGTYGVSTMTTDAQGNASSTASTNAGSGGDMFQVEPQSGAGYTAGFAVPQ
ncbi:MAG: Ig-like domain-containing protein [Acidobacteriota bacterium]